MIPDDPYNGGLPNPIKRECGCCHEHMIVYCGTIQNVNSGEERKICHRCYNKYMVLGHSMYMVGDR